MEGFSTAVLYAEGATSQVYRGMDETTGRPVAIKVLKSVDGELARRFRFEAEVLQRLDHPGIARLIEAGEWDGRPFLATEFIEGAPIDRALAGASAEAVVRVFVKVADALAHAHDHGLLHRDLKPANVLVRRGVDDTLEPVIVDFGLAADLEEPTRTASGALLGTPAFMAPEQAEGSRDRVGRWTDIYGLGAVLYACMAGRPPYGGESAGNLIASILAGPPPRPGPGVPRKLEAIIDCAMARRPERRYGSARRMAADLTAWRDGQSVRALRGFWWRLAGRTMRRYWWATAGAIAVIVMLGALGVQQVWLKRVAIERQELVLALNERLALNRERMRLAHLAPLHDITPALARQAQEIEALRQISAAPTTRREPAVLLVLGKMLMDAGRNEEAVQALQRARELGCDSDRCAAALALGYLRQYEQRLERELMFSTSVRDTENAPELDRARELLGEVSVAGNADFRLAALSRPVDELVRRVELVVSDQPWQYDALLALAETRYRAGLEAMRADRTADATRLLTAAESDFERAARIARSLPEAYLGACRAHARRLELVSTLAPEEAGTLEALPESCEVARAVLPGHVASYSLPALVLERLSVRARRAGDLAGARAQIESAQRILERVPPGLNDQPALQSARARVLATSVGISDLDASEQIIRLREALELARSATETQPDSTPAWHTRAVAVALLSERDTEDAVELAREAEDVAVMVAERMPGQRSVRNLLGSALTTLAYRQRLADGSGREALERGLAVLRALVEDAPDYDSARNNLGMAYWELALHELTDGGDFERAERLAREQFRRILKRKPDYPSALVNLSSLNLTLADALIEAGRSPGDRPGRSIELLGELRDDGHYFACDLAFAYWLKIRLVDAPEQLRALRAQALEHARADDGADCLRVRDELSTD